MKKLIITSIIALALIVVGTVAVKSAGLYYIPSATYGLASTTATYVAVGGTVPKTFASDGTQEVAWLVAVGSSTTPPTVSWTNFYSNNGTDWYAEDQTFASTTAHNPSEKVETWVYATSSATTILSTGSNGVTKFIGRRIVVPNLNTTFTKTIFTVTGAAALVDVRSALKNEVVLNK